MKMLYEILDQLITVQLNVEPPMSNIFFEFSFDKNEDFVLKFI